MSFMRYWDDDNLNRHAEERTFATEWRKQPKSVRLAHVEVGRPTRTLVEDPSEGAIRKLKAARDGEIEDCRPGLAQSSPNLA